MEYIKMNWLRVGQEVMYQLNRNKMEQYKFDEINGYDAERYSAKMNLDTFTADLNNSFEPSADKEIERLISEINELTGRYSEFEIIDTTDKKQQEIANIETEKHFCWLDIEYLKEEIWAIAEMKIIYSFKFLEISIKQLIRTSFDRTKIDDFYKWNSLISFLKSNNIRPEKLIGYQEVIQIKDVNNSLKHTGEISEELKKRIPEFREKEQISFVELNLFYSRIRTFPNEFIRDLASAIYTELYDFDENKIGRIADNIAYRMEKGDIDLLISALRSRY